MKIQRVCNLDDIGRCFDVFQELRPHLNDLQQFIDQVMTQQKEGYKIFVISDDDVFVACIGFRLMTTLAWGKILYVDDLISKEAYRGKGYGRALLDYALTFAKENGCHQIHLDTGYTRHAAHKAYLRHGFEFHCHHLLRNIT